MTEGATLAALAGAVGALIAAFVVSIFNLVIAVIKHALKYAEGSVTRAASNLGISYQELHYMLTTRHNDLLKYRLQCSAGHGKVEAEFSR